MKHKILSTSNCDVAQVFSAPPSAGASVTIDGSALVPSPFLNLTLEKYSTGDIITGGVLRVQLSGTVVGASFDEVAATGSGSAQSIKDVLELSANSDCVVVEIQCGSQFIKGAGKITSFTASEGNQPSWVNYAPYTVEIELYENLLTSQPYVKKEGADTDLADLSIKDLSEEFTIDINENAFNWDTIPGAGAELKGAGNRHVRVSFAISAAGLGGSSESCSGEESGTPTLKGLEAVEEYMIRRLGRLKNMDVSGVADPPDTEIVDALAAYRGESFLDFRSLNVNPIENRMSISGEIIYRPSGCHSNVFSTINVEESLNNEGNDIVISGNITGLVDVQYDTIIRSTTYLNSGCDFNDKMTNANSFFELVKGQFQDIAYAHGSSSVVTHSGDTTIPLDSGKNYIKDTCVSTSGGTEDPCLSAEPSQTPEFCELRLISSQVSRNYGAGEINFNFTYNNKTNCNIPGARSVEIEATHDMPRDNIVEIVVPGRGSKGVLTQNLCVLSSEKWTLSLNATLISNSCGRPSGTTITQLRNCAKGLLETFKDDNSIDTNCWFITDRQETLGNKSYRYNIQYTKPSCP